MKKWLLALSVLGVILLAFLPQLGFAETVPQFGDNAATSWFHFAPRKTDISIQYLCSIFGNIEGVLSCSARPDSIFGSLFKVLNLGMLAIAGLILIFTTVKTITETASDGSAMGQHTSHWVIVRTVIGNSLLVPRASGFSVINAIVMWMVVQGVGFADMAWDKILDYLAMGNVVHMTAGTALSSMPPSQTDITKATVLDPAFVGGTSSDAPTATDIFRSLVCMNALSRGFQDLVQNARNNAPDSVKSQLAGITLAFNPEFDTNAKILRFPKQPDPYMYNKLKTALQSYGGYDLSRFDNMAGICGAYSWGTPTVMTNYSGVNVSTYQQAKQQGLSQMISTLNYPAKSLVNNVFDNVYQTDSSGKFANAATLQDSIASSLVMAAQQYFNTVNSVRSTFFTTPRPQSGGTGLPAGGGAISENAPIRADGWAAAGKYFWNIVKPPRTAVVSVSAVSSDVDFLNYGFGGTNNAPLTYPIDYSQNASGGNRAASWSSLKSNILDSFVNTKDSNLGMLDKTFFGDRTSSIQNVLSLVDNASSAAYLKAKALAAQAQAQSSGGFIGMPFSSSSASGYKETTGLSLQGFNLTETGEMLKSQALEMGIPGVEYAATGVGAKYGLPLAVRGWARWIPGMFLVIMGDMLHQWNITMADPTLSPIEKTMTVGTAMVQAAQDFWVGLFNLFIYITQVLGLAIQAFSIGGIAASAFGWVAVGASILQQIFGTAVTVVWQTVQTAFTIFLPATIGISVPLFVTGLTLSVYVPLIPFLLFTFGVISWLIFVLESMAASPLIALGVTHPQGDVILGKAEQGLMMLVSVFLRPIMMIIGMTSGIVISYVAVSILNYGMADLIPFIVGKAQVINPWVPYSSPTGPGGPGGHGSIIPEDFSDYNSYFAAMKAAGLDAYAAASWAARGIYSGGEAIYHGAGDFFRNSVNFDFGGQSESTFGVTTPKILMIIVIYTFTVVALINQCFSLIYRFPDEIMKYIGGVGHQGAEAEKLMEGIKGEAKEYGGAIGGMGRGMEGAGRVGEVVGAGMQTKNREMSEGASQKLKGKEGGSSGGSSSSSGSSGSSGGGGKPK